MDGFWDLNWFEKEEVSDLVPQFPGIFDRAVADWAKYKVALRVTNVPLNKRREVETWFAEFPKLWETIRPNWVASLPGETPSSYKIEFAHKVDNWVKSLKAWSVDTGQGLGIAPLIIAGVLIAGALGVGGAIWAIGYVKKQDNISRIITEVTTGRVPSSVLEKAVEEERSGFFPDFKGITETVLLVSALGVGAYFVLPMLKKGRR